MPHIRIRALPAEQIAQLGQKLLPELAEATQTPEDHFSLEAISSQYFIKGKAVEGDPFCEVLWFDRGPEMQDRVAALITAHLKAAAPDKDVVVVFVPLTRVDYFENGVHF